jgi:hypothetical protein
MAEPEAKGMSDGPVFYLDEARCLMEARKVLADFSGPVIWSRTVSFDPAGFRMKVRVELSRDLMLRVVVPRTGVVLCEGSAFAQKRG